MIDWRTQIEGIDALPRAEALLLLDRFLSTLERGEIRAAIPDAEAPGGWRAQPWVKQGILAAFRLGTEVDLSWGGAPFRDRGTVLPQTAVPEGVRLVPGGTSLRRGAHLGAGTVVMPPAYVNVGAFVDEKTMIDSHALAGSCAQLGRRVHLSAAAQVGGVLEPVGALPVIIEDDVFVGGNCGVYEGVIVKSRAVLAAGVILTGSSAVYDLVSNTIHRADPAAGSPLVIPAGAVVVMGSRPASGEFAREQGLSLATPVIVKYRDGKTDAKTALEGALRR